MKIALIQAPLVWESITANVDYFQQQLDNLDAGVDLVVLPEMFTTGFTMNPQAVAQTINGSTLLWMQQLCIVNRWALTGSVVVKEGSRFFNRLYFVFPDGSYQTYDKRHLFSLAGEEKVYQPGTKRLIVEYLGWNICPLVCYDLRFPAFARNNRQAYDLLIYVASWPDQRIYAWDALLKARAIENMSYTIGVNRTGTDENNNVYSGHSQALDFLGQYIVEPQTGEAVVYLQIQRDEQDRIRKKLAFLNDADNFELLP